MRYVFLFLALLVGTAHAQPAIVLPPGSSIGGAVSSFNGRIGPGALQSGDVTGLGSLTWSSPQSFTSSITSFGLSTASGDQGIGLHAEAGNYNSVTWYTNLSGTTNQTWKLSQG